MRRILAALLILGTTARAQQAQDIQSIKSFCGCFDIEFKYAEIFPSDSNYKMDKPYFAHAREWVEMIEEQPNKLVMQHLLVINDSTIIKHWREDWTYQNTTQLKYQHSFTWQKLAVSPESVKGKWTQTVWEVNDEPRYQGTATWIHDNGNSSWYNATDAPLPRREYSHRSDYNVLNRTNYLRLHKGSWVHEQDNQKIIRKDGKADSLLVMEKGYNIYTIISDEKCSSAKKWWQERKHKYVQVRKDWDAKIEQAANEIKL